MLACRAIDRSRQPISYPLHARIVRALAGERPFEGRLSGFVSWKECVRSRSVAVRCERVTSQEAIDAAAITLARARGDSAVSSTDFLWAAAVLDLVAPPTAITIDRAVERLKVVLAGDSTNVGARNDLAVARLVRHGERRDALSGLQALDDIERAGRDDSSSAIIAFNRAVILDRLALRREAAAAWERLGAAGTEGWSGDARGRLGTLRAGLTGSVVTPEAGAMGAISASPQVARESVLNEGIGAWARAVLRGDSSVAATVLRRNELVGTVLATSFGDSSTFHLVASLRPLQGDGLSSAARFIDGATEFRAGGYLLAEPRLRGASQGLRAAGAPQAADWADLLRAAIDVYGSAYAAADARFGSIARRALARGDSALRARALWGLGLSAAPQGHLADSGEDFRQAAEIFGHIGEPSNRAASLGQYGDMLYAKGNDAAALDAKLAALSAFNPTIDAARQVGLLIAFARELEELGLNSAGIALLREASRCADYSSRPSDKAEVLVRLADALAASGEASEGMLRLGQARVALARLTDTLMYTRIAMEVASAEASVDARDAPRRALEKLSSVVRYFERRGIVNERVLPLARRARLALAIADSASAERDLAEAIANLEAQSPGGTDPATARQMRATRREVYRELVDIRVTRNDTLGAFLMSERGRGHHVDRGAPVQPGRVILSYMALRNRMVVWILNNNTMRMVVVPSMGAEPARQASLRLETALQTEHVVADSLSRDLYARLVAPAAEELHAAKELVIVPDGPLSRLPFAALQDARGRYLIEQLSLTYASSTRAWRADRQHDARVLLVGAPMFDRALFSGLSALPGVSREVSILHALYPSALVLDSLSARKVAVTAAMRGASIFHFAGHARLVERTPTQSHLVLARQGGGIAANTLSASEIASLDLRSLRLAVLSSCGTAQAHSLRDDTADGLSDAFLDAGATAVISSLWEADDSATPMLMSELYRALRAGHGPARALQRAQVAMLAARPRQPIGAWSTFRLERR